MFFRFLGYFYHQLTVVALRTHDVLTNVVDGESQLVRADKKTIVLELLVGGTLLLNYALLSGVNMNHLLQLLSPPQLTHPHPFLLADSLVHLFVRRELHTSHHHG